MDFWSPIRAHAEWIALLREALYDRGTLTVREAADHEGCELGRWLRDNERELGHLDEFRAAKAEHARFHRRAAHCLRLAESGNRTEAIAETEQGGELRRLSRQLVAAFQRLKRKARRDADMRASELGSRV